MRASGARSKLQTRMQKPGTGRWYISEREVDAKHAFDSQLKCGGIGWECEEVLSMCALMDFFRWPDGVYQRVDRIAGISCNGAGVSAYDVTMHAGAMARNRVACAFPEATEIVY